MKRSFDEMERSSTSSSSSAQLNSDTQGTGKRKADVSKANLQEKIGGIEREIIEEMRASVFGSHETLIDTHFDLPEEHIDAIYRECLREAEKPGSHLGYDAQNERWKPFPTLKGAPEATLYQPFCDAANLISRIAAKRQGRPEPRLHWRPVPHAAPRNDDPMAAKLKPDIIATINGKCSPYFERSEEPSPQEGDAVAPSSGGAGAVVEGSAPQAQGTDGSRGVHVAASMEGNDLEADSLAASNAPRPHNASTAKDATPAEQSTTKDVEKNAWRFVVLPVEGKTSANATALAQILRYQRQVFLNEHARRFTYSMVFANRFLTAYLTDRSGTIGATRFDMHEFPRTFIRVIAGLEMKSPEELGWDTTMKLVSHSTDWSKPDQIVFKETYEVDPEPLVDGNHYPVVQMPKPDSNKLALYNDDMKMDSFVLHEPISLNRGRVIVGRATRIWRAWKMDDMHLPQDERKDYVVKDMWRDERRGTEGELYAQIHKEKTAPGVAELYSYGVVRCRFRPGDKLRKDSTKNIRRKLEVTGVPLCIDATVTRPRVDIPLFSPTKSDSYVTMQYTGVLDELPEAHDIYTTSPTPDDGRIPAPRPQIRVHSRLVLSTYGTPVKFFESCLQLVQVMKDAIEGHHNAYKAGVLHRDISVGNILILDDASKQRLQRVGALIDFDNGIRWSPDRQPVSDDPLSGTMPFVSAELLLREPYFDQLEGDTMMTSMAEMEAFVDNEVEVIIFHTWLHDLDSLFWVFLWCALTRGGPGGRRRQELWINAPANKQLRTWFFTLYEADIRLMAATKRTMMIAPTALIRLLNSLPDFCKPLRRLLLNYFDILRTAFLAGTYRSDYNNTIHDALISAFTEAEMQLRANPPASLPATVNQPQMSSPTHSSQSKLREDTSPYAPNPASRPIAAKPAKSRSQKITQEQPAAPRTPQRNQFSHQNTGPPIPAFMEYQSSPLAAMCDDESDEEAFHQGGPGSPSPAERKGTDMQAGKRQKTRRS
ncbi:hypothetical protein K474DRAFT_1775008 [Panus rudis PR-1116 ss-1]|nr:hypothetical protein K474DRAFT_1775008 [Panus rudis PR-1116 ss-1]